MSGLAFPGIVLTGLPRCVALAACAWLLAAPARAQVCDGIPGPAAQPAPGERFALLAAQCPTLAGPLKPHRAAQLELYDRQPSLVADPGGPDAGPGSGPHPATDPSSGSRPVPDSRPGLEFAAGADAASPFVVPASGGLAQHRLAPRGRDAARIISLAPAITATAVEFGIDPLLLHAVAHIESRHDAKAVSHAGARGLMQVMPATARRFGVGDPERALFDAQVNLRASAAYLQQLRQRYGEDLRLILAAYNAGEGAVSAYGGVPPYAETQAYVRNVLAVYRRLGQSFSVSPAGHLVERGSR